MGEIKPSDAAEQKSGWWILLSALLEAFWDMRWYLFVVAAILVTMHFAIAYADTLFPNRRSLSSGEVFLCLVIVGLFLWGHISEAQKRISKLEEKIEILEAKIEERG